MADPEVIQGKPVADAEKGILRYVVQGREVLLTTAIVRKFFCAEADELSAMGFMGYCRAHLLDPFAKEVYLSVIDNRPSFLVAYTTFMKRAERHRKYKGFKAGLVLQREDDAAIPIESVTGVVPAPLVAIQGELTPPGYKCIGGWCLVYRTDREDPGVGVVAVADYLQLTREGKPRKIWGDKKPTMIRKTAIAHGFRDAFPDEVGDMRIHEEFDADKPTAAEAEPIAPTDRPTEAPQAALPPAFVPLFDRMGWNTAARVVFAAKHKASEDGGLSELTKQAEAYPVLPEHALVTSTPASGFATKVAALAAVPEPADQGMLDF